MSFSDGSIWHFLGASGDQDIQARMKSGQPCLLITGKQKSFLIDLDWSTLHSIDIQDDVGEISDFREWSAMMIMYVDLKLSQELVSGTRQFIRNARVWLEPHQRNYALFFIGSDGDDVVFVPLPAAV